IHASVRITSLHPCEDEVGEDAHFGDSSKWDSDNNDPSDEPIRDFITLTGRAPSHVESNYHGDHPQSVVYENDLGMAFAVQAR
ncbi:hypothetical protein H6F38_34535, partial [Paenibacillus sp. EKM208P]